jgi:hypothetical protein
MSIVTTQPELLHALLGGLLIGAAASGLLLVNGRIAGISGILANATARGAQFWQWAFLAGLLAAGALRLHAAPPVALTSQNLAVLTVAGLLVGFGTRLSGGCTSGHGVCGLARLSPRSLAAVLTFMAVAALTVFFRRHLL